MSPEILATAFLLGIMGSFHCIGMCGPIALSLPLQGNSYFQKLLGGVLYNLGRAVMYGIIGGAFGLIGQGFHLLGFQRWVSIIMGIILILSILFPIIFSGHKIIKLDFFVTPVRKAIQKLFTSQSYSGLFFIGTLNSLLPCGLVYVAVASAVTLGSAYYGMIYMFLFGLGTLPMMVGVVIIGNLISLSVRKRINYIIPYLVVIIGVIFILRGLCLGIPYVSPPLEKLTPTAHMKIHNPKNAATEIKGSCCAKD